MTDAPTTPDVDRRPLLVAGSPPGSILWATGDPEAYVERVLAVPLNGAGGPHKEPVLMGQALVLSGPRQGDQVHVGEVSGYVTRVVWSYPTGDDDGGMRRADVHVATADYLSVPRPSLRELAR